MFTHTAHRKLTCTLQSTGISRKLRLQIELQNIYKITSLFLHCITIEISLFSCLMSNLSLKILYFNLIEWDVKESHHHRLKEGPKVLSILHKSVKIKIY